MYVYSLDIPFSRVQQTAQFTPLVSELTLIRSHLLWGEFSAFSAANDISQCHFTFHNSPFFRSTRYPSLLGGQRRSGMRGFAQHLYTQVYLFTYQMQRLSISYCFFSSIKSLASPCQSIHKITNEIFTHSHATAKLTW